MSIRSTIRAVFALSALAAAAPALAQAEAPGALSLSGSVALVSDYRFRGVSQSGGDPAVQGGVSATHASGLYAGAWGSSISLGPAYGSMELDLYGGYSREVLPGVTADVGLTYYAYPGGRGAPTEFLEPSASLATTYGPARIKLGVNYAWSQAALGDRDNLYVYSSVDVGVPRTPLTVTGKLGYQDGALSAPFVAGSAQRHGWDWSAGVSATLLGKLTLGASYIGVSGPSVKGLTDDKLVGTLTLSF
jgi:uncharacterized protein (TIGR02001 family)